MNAFKLDWALAELKADDVKVTDAVTDIEDTLVEALFTAIKPAGDADKTNAIYERAANLALEVIS